MAYNPRKANGNLRKKHREMWKRRGLPCAICGKDIDYTLGMVTDPRTGKRKPHPYSFVIDEIVPVARYWEGGYSSPEACAQDVNNQRPCHWICNARRGDGTGGARASIHVVMGAPCSGKTTFVKDSKSTGDVVIDLDAIACALGFEKSHGADGPILKAAFAARKAAISAAKGQRCRMWIIHTQPDAKQVDEYRRMGAQFHICDPGIETCLKRAREDSRPLETESVIRQWYETGASAKATADFNERTTMPSNAKRVKGKAIAHDQISGSF